MESKTSRYQSRILREMHQNTENPFSPPSSTGSHGTVTLTSDMSHIPEGESTRRMDDTSIKLPSQAAKRDSAGVSRPLSFNVNTSVLGRAFPEWKGLHQNRLDDERDMWEIASDTVPEAKENIPPSPGSSVAATARARISDRNQPRQNDTSAPKDAHPKANVGSLRTQAHMQATVQNEPESSVLFQSPARSETLRDQPKRPSRQRSSSPNAIKGSNSRRGNVTTLLETLKTAQTKKAESRMSSSQLSPKQVPSEQRPAAATPNAAKIQMDRRSRTNNDMSPATSNQTARSFFLPNLTHMNDFVSGALRWSSLKNGTPIFVKHGKVHDRETNMTPDHHAEVEAVAIPDEEQKIFVSLDMIREEIHALKEHDDLVSKQAEQFQDEIHQLQIQIAKHKSRKDSAMGSESETSVVDHLTAQKSQLEEQVTSLQGRLDKANRKISINEIHTESYIAERDEALKNSNDHAEKIKRLQLELNKAQQQLDGLRGDDTRDVNTLELENRSLRNNNNSIREQWKSLLEENQSLRSHNGAVTQQNSDLEHDLLSAQAKLDSVRDELASLQDNYHAILEETAILKQDNLSLERHNDKYFHDNKALQQKNALLERRNHDLQDDIARLQELVDAADAQTGTITVSVKDMRTRFESQNRQLAQENAEFQQELIDMQAGFATTRMEYQQERRRLVATNERLNDQLDQLSKKFTRVVKESKEETARYEEQQASLTQQIQQITERQSALTGQLKKGADHEASLQRQLDRKAQAVNETRELIKEIENFRNTASNTKPAKVTRIVEPKGKSTMTGEMSARSTTHTDMPLQDDYTQQFDLTQGSELAEIYSKGEAPRAREALRHARSQTKQRDQTEESLAFDGGVTDEVSQSLPPMYLPQSRSREIPSHRTTSATSRGQVDSMKSQPLSILKNAKPSRLNSEKQKNGSAPAVRIDGHPELDETIESLPDMRRTRSDDTVTRQASLLAKKASRAESSKKVSTNNVSKSTRQVPEQDTTGRFSVKSGFSGMSIPSQTSQEDIFHRPNSASAGFDLESNHGENMTSALFMDDITLETQKRAEQKQKQQSENVPKILSPVAKRVLDHLCNDHECVNCILCTRINLHRHDEDGTTNKKKTVRIERPIPVTDRVSNPQSATTSEYEDQPTLRPSQDPALALAKVIKGLKDEERHFKTALRKKQVVYDECDPAMNKRLWKKLDGEIQTLRRQRDLKRDQIYDLHDVLEGQKAKGQEMNEEILELTLWSVLSKDPTWNGILDY